jgi:NAD(P) transhydrogenase subunit alpha
VLVTEDMVKSMRSGSVIVDLAVEQGGNCPLSRPNQVIEVHGVTIMGYTNLPAHLAADTSNLYARNLFNFVSLMVDKKTGAIAIDWNDEIIKGTAVTRDGQIVHPSLRSGQ